MKLTKDRLKQIIKEELEEIMTQEAFGSNPIEPSNDPNAGLISAIRMFKKAYKDLSRMNPNLTGPQKIDKSFDVLTSAQQELLFQYLPKEKQKFLDNTPGNAFQDEPDMGKAYVEFTKQGQMQERKRR